MRHWYQALFGAGLDCFLVNSQFGNLLNPSFGLAESIQDVIAGASNTTYTDVCPESDFQTRSDGKAGKRSWLKLCSSTSTCLSTLI